MSDFKIKVTADLDTSQVEAKLMALQNRKITIQANAILWILELVSYLLNNPVPVSLLSGDRKPQIRFLGNHHSGSGNLYHKSFRM